MAQLGFYRQKSALQIQFVPPKQEQDSQTKFNSFSRFGSIILQAANGENNKYNWNEKITFAISIADIPAILDNLLPLMNPSTTNPNISFSLVHNKALASNTQSSDPNYVTLSFSTATNKPGYYLSLSHQQKKVVVGLSRGEL